MRQPPPPPSEGSGTGEVPEESGIGEPESNRTFAGIVPAPKGLSPPRGGHWIPPKKEGLEKR